MYYAGYRDLNTDVAVFETERQRNNWINSWSAFDRIALSEGDVWFILDGMPENAERERDILDDSIIWLLNPFNSCL